MKKFFLRSVLFFVVLFVIGIFNSGMIQAQCFHLGQAFDCKGLPEGTSSSFFNPDGSIHLSNGQNVPANFFDTPFVAPGPVTPIITITDGSNPPVVIIPSQPLTGLPNLFPTTVNGQNALTFMSNPFEPNNSGTWAYIERMYRRGYTKAVSDNSLEQSLYINDRWKLNDRWSFNLGVRYDEIEISLNKNFSDNWGLVTSYRNSRLIGNYQGFFATAVPFDPETAKKLLDEAGWTAGDDQTTQGGPAGPYSPLTYYLSTSSFGRHDIKIGGEDIGQTRNTYHQQFLGGIEFEVARSVSLGVRNVDHTPPRFSPKFFTTWDPKGDGDWVFNASYDQYVSALANSPEGSPSFEDKKIAVFKGNEIDIGVIIRLSEQFGKLLDQLDGQAAPIPEIIVPSIDLEPPSELSPPIEEDNQVM